MILFAFLLFALLVAGWLAAPNGSAKASAKEEAGKVRLQVSESAA